MGQRMPFVIVHPFLDHILDDVLLVVTAKTVELPRAEPEGFVMKPRVFLAWDQTMLLKIMSIDVSETRVT